MRAVASRWGGCPGHRTPRPGGSPSPPPVCAGADRARGGGPGAESRDPGLLGDHADRFEQTHDLQHDRDRFRGTRPEGDRDLHGLEPWQRRRDDIVAGRQTGGPVGAVRAGHMFLAPAGAGHRHHDARSWAPVRVDDGAFDRASRLAGHQRGGRQRQQYGGDGEAGRVTGDQCSGFYTGDPLSEYSTRQTTGGGAKTVGRVEEEEKGDPSP